MKYHGEVLVKDLLAYWYYRGWGDIYVRCKGNDSL